VDLIREGENGWLFELAEPASFHVCLEQATSEPESARRLALAGQRRGAGRSSIAQCWPGGIKHLYQELMVET